MAATAPTISRERRPTSTRWFIGAAVLAALAVAALLLRPRAAPTATVATVAATSGPIVASVTGSGQVAAQQSLDMAFSLGGTVTDVLVEEGDVVRSGQPLIALDNRELMLQVENAESALTSAQVRLEQTSQGNATPQDLAAAQASVRNAEAQLTRTRSGNVTSADIRQAEASLRAAQAQLDALTDPSADKRSTAQLALSQAQANLQTSRDSLSQAKTNADAALQQAVNNLTIAQSAYATAKSNWDYVQDTGKNPANPTTTNSQGKTVANTLNDTQRQQYYDAFVQAEAALHSAETAVQQAQAAYETARQNEVIGVQEAEAVAANAQQQLDALQNPSATSIAQAQAAVDQAQAQLDKLRAGGTQADIAASQAAVDQAQAQLEKLNAPATDADISIQQQAVAQAEQALELAKLKLEQATITAPFDAIVTTVNVVPGTTVAAGSRVISLVDRATLHVDLTLSESDVAQVQATMPVTLTISALPEWQGQGTITYVAPAAQSVNDVVTYAVKASFPDTDPLVKVGMTADVTIVIAEKAKVLLVPNTALMPKGAERVVQVLGDDGQIREIAVTTGLSDGQQTEITSGLDAGARVVAVPDLGITTTQSGGLLGGLRR